MPLIRFIKILIDGSSIGNTYGNNGVITITELQAFKRGSTTNYALTAVATAASYNGSSTPSKAIDGTTNTVASAYATHSGTGYLNLNGSQWLLLDLGSIMTIDRLVLYTSYGSGYSPLTDYRVQTSTDGVTFTTVKTISGFPAISRFDSLNLSYVNNVGSMNTGDYIPCLYNASMSGSIGTFSKLGIVDTTTAELSNSPGATGSGLFYFIMVGYDLNGNQILIADRVLQSTISWDVLNTAGIASGSGLPLTIDSYFGMFTIRLLSGGITSTDLYNEWDQILVSSTLGGTITAGDLVIWNQSTVGSWTSTTNTTGSTYRTVRGTTILSDSTGLVSSTSSTVVGFRPVLLDGLQQISMNSLVVNPTHVYLTDSNISISTTFNPAGYSNILSDIQTFTSADSSKLITTPYTVLNGSLTLTNSSQNSMTDAGALGTGELFTATIDFTKFNSISKVEVL